MIKPVQEHDLEDCDLLVVNGEGTFHHNGLRSIRYLGYMKMALEMKKSVHLINTVWHEMSSDWKPLLKKCELLEVREVLSQKEMDCGASIVLDASMHLPVENLNLPREGICIGNHFSKNKQIDISLPHENISIFDQTWTQLVQRLQRSKLLVTGRHHEMCAALKARTPVLIIKGNSWKNEGFFHTVEHTDLLLKPNVKNITDTLEGKYDKSWNEVWHYLDSYNYKYNNVTKHSVNI